MKLMLQNEEKRNLLLLQNMDRTMKSFVRDKAEIKMLVVRI